MILYTGICEAFILQEHLCLSLSLLVANSNSHLLIILDADQDLHNLSVLNSVGPDLAKSRMI